MSRPLCVYHGNCADGFGAAWVVRHFYGGEVDFFPGVYQSPPPDCTDRDVIMVDFCYKRPVLLNILRECEELNIIDHHKTALQEIEGLTEGQQVEPSLHGKLFVTFDLERSGAGLTWDYFYADAPRPPLINHIEDHDLWRFKLPRTREIQAALFSYPYDFEVWDRLIGASPDKLADEGTAIERKHHKDIAELVKVTQREMVIGSQRLPVANLPYTLTSDAGFLMATKHPSRMAACYWDTPAGRVFSLRSTEYGPDVSEIAKLYGGGGHAHAAGFRTKLGWEGE